MIVSVEGIDFSGKTTQTELLKEIIPNTRIIKCPLLTNITGSIIGDHLAGKIKLSPELLLLLFSANRIEQLDRIKKYIAKGNNLICDRFSESEYAYGAANNLPEEWLQSLEYFMPKADIVILLDIDPAVSLSRGIKEKRDVIENDIVILQRARENYLIQYKKSLGNAAQYWVLIDGSMPIETVHSSIIQELSKNFPNLLARKTT